MLQSADSERKLYLELFLIWLIAACYSISELRMGDVIIKDFWKVG